MGKNSATAPATTADRAAITGRLVDFVVRTRLDDVPAEAIHRAKLSFFDAVGVAIGGSLEPGPRILARFVQDCGGKPVASVVGHGFKTTAQYAAWVNGTATDVNGWADFSVAHMNHPTASVCPAALALGEARHATGRDVLLAYILGVEISNKIARGVKPGFHIKGWHALGVCNTFGAAAAAGKLLGLDREKLANAFGIAGAEASGIKASMVTMTKSYVAGGSARDGITAAQLAQMGYTGPRDVMEARDGFLQTFGDGASGDKMLENLGDPFEFVSPGLTLKSYPSCTHTHTGIHAALGLKREHNIRPEQVESVECAVSPVVADFLQWHDPRDKVEAKFSMEFCVASALVEGKLDMDNFTEEKLTSPATRALMRCVRMSVSPELARLGYNPEIAPSGCILTIRMKNGTEYVRRQYKGPWEPETPPTWEALGAKFRSCARVVLPTERVDRAMALLRDLEQLDDIGGLMDLVRGPLPTARS
ncbi:MAG: MmgE/PrpD family protein [Betaproteobacteria bacterium]|nr:MmgE/PrpD family protein [Betaproteobacteria bacterium]